jgi:hypothetical protein
MHLPADVWHHHGQRRLPQLAQRPQLAGEPAAEPFHHRPDLAVRVGVCEGVVEGELLPPEVHRRLGLPGRTVIALALPIVRPVPAPTTARAFLSPVRRSPPTRERLRCLPPFFR